MLLGIEYEDQYFILEHWDHKDLYFFAHLDKQDLLRWKDGEISEKDLVSVRGRKQVPGFIKIFKQLILKEISGKEFLTHDSPVVRHIARAYLEKDFDWIYIFKQLVNLTGKKRIGKKMFQDLSRRPRYQKGKSLRVWHV